MTLNNNVDEPMSAFNSFALLIVSLAATVGLASSYFYKRSKQALKKTRELLEPE